MAIKTYQPKISIKLYKNLARATVGADLAASSRFTGTARQIDLTPYLGEGSQVVTSKSVRGGSGRWSVTLTDQAASGQLESLYGLIEPMDIIEIRMAHDISQYYGSNPEHMPIHMRGFVGQVDRRRAMTPRGPIRVVEISGQDYGRILEMINIVYLPGMVLGQNLLASYNLCLNYGPGAKSDQSAADFFVDIMTNVVAKFIADMRASVANSNSAGLTSPIMDISLNAQVGGGSISPFGSQEWQGGTVDALLRYFGDVGPWFELYVEDREDGPWLVYRPTPFKNLQGELVQPNDTAPAMVQISDDDVVEEQVGRSDGGVANYYWVDAPRYTLVDGALLKAGAAHLDPPPLLSNYPNSAPQFYGLRPMIVETQQGPRVDGQGQAQLDAGTVTGLGLVSDRRSALILSNQDNIVYESGALVLRGNEQIKAGCYIQRLLGSQTAGAGSSVSECYAHTVEHRFLPFQSYQTVVQFDRGTGFIVRAQQGGGVNSPYLADLNLGGVYGA